MQFDTASRSDKIEAPKGFRESAAIAHRGGKIAGETRAKIEAQTGRSIVTKDKAPIICSQQTGWNPCRK